jgi:hypothetical protein
MFTASRPGPGTTIHVGKTGLDDIKVMRDGPPLLRHVYVTQ